MAHPRNNDSWANAVGGRHGPREQEGVDGARVEWVLDLAHITLNKNSVAGDTSALVPGEPLTPRSPPSSCPPPGGR